jgi:hypothetical protein
MKHGRSHALKAHDDLFDFFRVRIAELTSAR